MSFEPETGTTFSGANRLAPNGRRLGALTISTLEDRAIAACLSGLSLNSRRCYLARIRAWQRWSDDTNGLSDRTPFDREHVKQHIRALELYGASPQVQNQTIAALKRLASEAAELGWLDHQTAAQIERIKSKKILGIRTGRWLTAAQSTALIRSIDRSTKQGRRDAAVLALLLGCGLRRAEACLLTVDQIRPHNDKTLLVNLVGKGGRVRSVGVPGWAAQILEQWRKDLK